MIKANELRIGNWVSYFEKDLCKITGVNKIPPLYHLYAIGENGYTSFQNIEDGFFAIPLTEEWLMKFGFEDGEIQIHGQTVSIRNNEYYLCGPDSATDGQTFSGEIKYVHQLQNLFFALTGEELKVKELV